MCWQVPLLMRNFNKNHQPEDILFRNQPGNLPIASLPCFLYERSENKAGKYLERSSIFLHSRPNNSHHYLLVRFMSNAVIFLRSITILFVLLLVLCCLGYYFVCNFLLADSSYHEIIILTQFYPCHEIFTCLTLPQMLY